MVTTRRSWRASSRTIQSCPHGFQPWLVADDCFKSALTDWNGAPRSAEDAHAMSLANLDGEYCTAVTADALFRALS